MVWGGRGSKAKEIPVGTDAFVEEHALKVIKKKGAEGLDCLCASIPGEQDTMPVATKAMKLKTGFPEQNVDALV